MAAVLERAKGWLMDVFVHHHAETLRINRQAQRKQLDVPGQDYPYPGGAAGNNCPTTIHHTGGGMVKGAILSAAMLAGGAAGMAGLQRGTAPPALPPVAVTQPTPTVAPAEKAWDAVTEQKQPDGSWKEIDRERLK